MAAMPNIHQQPWNSKNGWMPSTNPSLLSHESIGKAIHSMAPHNTILFMSWQYPSFWTWTRMWIQTVHSRSIGAASCNDSEMEGLQENDSSVGTNSDRNRSTSHSLRHHKYRRFRKFASQKNESRRCVSDWLAAEHRLGRLRSITLNLHPLRFIWLTG